MADTEYTKGFKAGLAYAVKLLESQPTHKTDSASDAADCWCEYGYDDAIDVLEKAVNGPE